MVQAVRAVRTYLVVLVVCGVGFGGFWGLLSWVLGADDPLRVALLAGAPFGIVMSGVLGTLQVVQTRGAPRGVRIGPRQRVEVPVVGGATLPGRVEAALRAVPATIQQADPSAGRWTAEAPSTWKSFGEEVVVQLQGDPAAPVAVVTSRPHLGYQLYDYGKGLANVTAVTRALQR